ncbi:MAG: hypothetical protein K0R12_1074 [Gammaproteobacteria bacterium]|jgi:hypothetical protein|nr:hypothetical protein [Gammaproteobacteria bacterium]
MAQTILPPEEKNLKDLQEQIRDAYHSSKADKDAQAQSSEVDKAIHQTIFKNVRQLLSSYQKGKLNKKAFLGLLELITDERIDDNIKQDIQEICYRVAIHFKPAKGNKHDWLKEKRKELLTAIESQVKEEHTVALKVEKSDSEDEGIVEGVVDLEPQPLSEKEAEKSKAVNTPTPQQTYILDNAEDQLKPEQLEAALGKAALRLFGLYEDCAGNIDKHKDLYHGSALLKQLFANVKKLKDLILCEDEEQIKKWNDFLNSASQKELENMRSVLREKRDIINKILALQNRGYQSAFFEGYYGAGDSPAVLTAILMDEVKEKISVLETRLEALKIIAAEQEEAAYPDNAIIVRIYHNTDIRIAAKRRILGMDSSGHASIEVRQKGKPSLYISVYPEDDSRSERTFIERAIHAPSDAPKSAAVMVDPKMDSRRRDYPHFQLILISEGNDIDIGAAYHYAECFLANLEGSGKDGIKIMKERNFRANTQNCSFYPYQVLRAGMGLPIEKETPNRLTPPMTPGKLYDLAELIASTGEGNQALSRKDIRIKFAISQLDNILDGYKTSKDPASSLELIISHLEKLIENIEFFRGNDDYDILIQVIEASEGMPVSQQYPQIIKDRVIAILKQLKADLKTPEHYSNPASYFYTCLQAETSSLTKQTPPYPEISGLGVYFPANVEYEKEKAFLEENGLLKAIAVLLNPNHFNMRSEHGINRTRLENMIEIIAKTPNKTESRALAAFKAIYRIYQEGKKINSQHGSERLEAIQRLFEYLDKVKDRFDSSHYRNAINVTKNALIQTRSLCVKQDYFSDNQLIRPLFGDSILYRNFGDDMKEMPQKLMELIRTDSSAKEQYKRNYTDTHFKSKPNRFNLFKRAERAEIIEIEVQNRVLNIMQNDGLTLDGKHKAIRSCINEKKPWNVLWLNSRIIERYQILEAKSLSASVMTAFYNGETSTEQAIERLGQIHKSVSVSQACENQIKQLRQSLIHLHAGLQANVKKPANVPVVAESLTPKPAPSPNSNAEAKTLSEVASRVWNERSSSSLNENRIESVDPALAIGGMPSL